MKLDVTATFKDIDGSVFGSKTSAVMVLENDYRKMVMDTETQQPKIVNISNPKDALKAGITVAYSLDKLEASDVKEDMKKYDLIERINSAKKTLEISDDEKTMIGNALFANKGLTTMFRGQLLSSIK